MTERPSREQYAEQIRLVNRLTEPAIRQAVADLAPATGSAVLDAGCGIGIHALYLAGAVGEGGSVTGVDISPDNVRIAREHAARSPLGGRVTFREGDVLDLPLDDDSFDGLWCADTLYMLDPDRVLGEFKRVVRPGGAVALAFWSGQMLLPGHPALEARLGVAFSRHAPNLVPLARPDRHFLRALGWLSAAGLEDVEVRTYVASATAPLEPVIRDAVAYTFSMMWGDLEPHLPAGDWSEYRRLCDASSPDFIADRPDYHCFVNYSVFTGRVPA